MFHSLIRKPLALLVILSLLFIATGCTQSSDQPSVVTQEPAVESAATAAPTAEPALPLEWPADEAIAYCPVFDAASPISVIKQEGNQEKVYALKYAGITAEQYLAYVEQFEASEGVVIDTNTNLRDNAYSLNAHKADDHYLMIRVVYTRATQDMVISVTFAHPDVM